MIKINGLDKNENINDGIMNNLESVSESKLVNKLVSEYYTKRTIEAIELALSELDDFDEEINVEVLDYTPSIAFKFSNIYGERYVAYLSMGIKNVVSGLLTFIKEGASVAHYRLDYSNKKCNLIPGTIDGFSGWSLSMFNEAYNIEMPIDMTSKHDPGLIEETLLRR